MGNYITGPMIQQQKQIQQEMQQNQLKAQERMIRRQLAFQLAFSKDMLNWMGTGYGLILLGATAATIKQKKFPPFAAIPIIFGGLVVGYNYDFVYGDKVNRVQRYYEEIIKNEDYWFIPIEVKDREAKGKPTIY